MIDVWRRIRIAGKHGNYALSAYYTLESMENKELYIEDENGSIIKLYTDDVQELVDALLELNKHVEGK